MTSEDPSTASVEKEEFPEWMEEFVLPYVRDFALSPVLLALIGHVMLIVALVMLSAIRDRFIPAWGALFVLVMATGGVVRFEVRILGRPGGLTGALVLTWLMGLGVAALAAYTGFL